ncbi:MAG: hypothetical protein ACYTE3_03670 [Planctomycetota bacterium]
MRTIHRARLVQAVCATLILLTSTSHLCAYPPDNAAVLYYRACLVYDANSTMTGKLTDFVKGNIGADKEIKDYVERNKFAIKYFVDAGESPNSDWGLDYSEGIQLQMPHYAPLRTLGKIVLARAKIASDSADHKQALDLCLSVHRASAHIADGGILISHLVGISLNAMANQCVTDIIPQISDDIDMLFWLKSQIDDVSQRFPSIKTSMNSDFRICAQDIRKDKIERILEMVGDSIPKKQLQIIRNGDSAFFKANREYFLEYFSDCLTAVDLPYPQSYKQLVKLSEKPAIESKKNPNATIAAYFAPATGRIVCLDIRARTHFNAVKTALDLYMTKVKTGQLPTELPEDMPKDLFSGRDFEYEKTKDGFLLRCRGKDLGKDETYQYEFKVTK